MLKKLICLSLCAAMLFAASCKKENKDNSSGGFVRPTDVLLASFDSYSEGFQLMRVLDKFGAININENSEFATSGKSAKLQPLGGYISTAIPTCYYPFKSQAFGFDYQDVTYLKKIEVDFYNVESHDLSLTMGLVTEVKNTDLITKCNKPEKIALKPGKNTVAYTVDTSVLGILYDVTAFEGVYFSFDRVGSREIEDAPVVYMDNLYLRYGEQKGEAAPAIELGNGEILSFEKSWQRYTVSVDCENLACEPQIEIVKLSSLGIAAQSGGQKGLKVTFPAGGTSYGSWNRLVIPETVMKRCEMTSLKEEEYADYYLCMDFYGVSGGSMNVYPEFFDSGYSSCDNKWSKNVVEGQWSTLSVRLSEIDPYKVSHPGFFRLAWAEFVGDPIEIIIDNVRIEKR